MVKQAFQEKETVVKGETDLRTLVFSIWEHAVVSDPQDRKNVGLQGASVDMTIVTDSSQNTLMVSSAENTLLAPGEKKNGSSSGTENTLLASGSRNPVHASGAENTLLASGSRNPVHASGAENTLLASDSNTGRNIPTLAGQGDETESWVLAASRSGLVVQPKNIRQSNEKRSSATFLADYEIQKVLGEGGMGTVYLARQTSIDREIALKMIKTGVALDVDTQAKFLAEAAVTGDLEHPNIIPIYDLGVTNDGALFYSMKQAKGINWKETIKKKSQQENLEIWMKVADAVAFAHSRSIIHRDLKPENVLSGEFGEVLLTDWGLAASVSDRGKIQRLTERSATAGTPAYMAPEMALGEVHRIGCGSDVYLLGAILYEIVTGKCPHSGKTILDALYNVAQNVISPTDKKGELVDIAMKAMAAMPEHRYPDVKSLQQAVRDTQKHYESILLADKAQARLEEARKDGTYENYSNALFGFQEALSLWEQNRAAQEGLSKTRTAYADCALKKEDLDLAASLIEPVRRDFADLSKEIRRRMGVRDARIRRVKVLTYASVSLVLIVVGGLLYANHLVSEEKRQAKESEQLAKEEKVKAEQARLVAEKQTEEAKKQKQIADQERKLAEVSTQKAEEAKLKAEEARKRSEIAKKNAEEQATIARQQKALADEARKDAENQKVIAENKRAEAEANRQLAQAKKAEADSNLKIANERLAEITQMGILKNITQKSLTPEEAQESQKKQADAKGMKVDWAIPVGDQVMNVSYIPSGSFVMGSDVSDRDRGAEEYLHAVELTQPFYMGRCEVTRAQWNAVMGQPTGPNDKPELQGNLPVVNVSFQEVIQEFLPRIQSYAPSGYAFRLPTEAEWEYACRAGTYTPFHIGEEVALPDCAWYYSTNVRSLQPTGQKQPNAWGLFDMHGNAAELCFDFYGARFYLDSQKENPVNDLNGVHRIVRSGSWMNPAPHCRSAYRSYVHPENRSEFLGLRLVLVAQAGK